MMRPRHLAPLLVLVAACGGDDGVNHLADAPSLPDAPADAAIDTPDPMVTLTTSLTGSGTGAVTSSPAGISCASGACSADFDPNTVVTLTAVPGTGSVFAGWGGACSGTTPTCDVTLAQATAVTATFDLARYAVTVTKSGAGTGTVAGNGINCGATCTVMVDHGTMLALTATPGNLSVFAGWGGACSGTAGCMVTVTGPTAISANFPLDTLTLFVTKGGNGAGTVTATGINCGADCDETYTAGQMVTLTAAASTGSTFMGWSGGGCTGTGTCTVTIAAATTVTATFTLQQFALTVARTGSGAGNVVSTPAGIACGIDCTQDYDYNSMVTLTATPSTGSMFSGWSGACTGTAMCVVSMTQARSVTATFTLIQFALTTAVAGNGTVTSSPAGISCPTDCTENYSFGQMVTLTAAAGTGSTFAGWGGACTNLTGTCTVTIDAAKSVSASFTLNTYTLTVAKAGTGTGTVTGTGITCGIDCTETVSFGTMITLTPAAAMGSTFAGWSGGGCSGMGACTVTVSAATTVTATFDLQTFTLTAAKVGNAASISTVTSSPAGISCGADCSELYSYGQVVMLTAAPGTGASFTGWSGGGCSGTGTCTVTVTAATTVTATFTLMQFALTVTPAGAGTGTVTSSPTGISCVATCTASFDYNTMVTLTAAPSMPSSTFGGWSGGGCSGTGTCTVTMTAATTVTATFNVATYALAVTRNGTGGGSVTSSPAGINCPAVGCSATYNYPTMVTLTPTPDATSDFAGWSGACTGTGPCTVTMSAMRAVTATFTLKTFTVSLTRSGTGTGTVSGGAINCGATCSASVSYGGSITLGASPSMAQATLSTFTGWNGAGCSGTNGCTITNITSDVSVDAGFKLKPNILFVTSGLYSGDLGGLSGADTICKGLASTAGLGGTYVAYISGGTSNAPIDAPSRVGSAAAWIRVDGRPLMQRIDEMHAGLLLNSPSITELGQDVGQTQFVRVWTGTGSQGTAVFPQCGTPSWTNSSGGEAAVGNATMTTSAAVLNGSYGCNQTTQRLYCLGVDRRASIN